MTDIVEKLRNPAPVPFGARPSSLMDEAADEIERLRAQVELLRRTIRSLDDYGTGTIPEHKSEMLKDEGQRERARKGGACDD